MCLAFAKASLAQSYVDLVKVSYGSVINAGYENSDEQTNVTLLNASITIPIPITDDIAVVTGAEFVSQGLELAPIAPSTNLSSLSLRAGLSWKHNEKWSGTYILLPKIAGEDLNMDGDNFFFGGLALVKYQQTERKQYRFGVYAADEAFGTLVTPILGMYYQNENKRLEVTANLPLTADANYKLNPDIAVGFGLQTQVRSYALRPVVLAPNLYVQAQNIEFGPYLQHAFLKQSILLNFQVGYASIDYRTYVEGDQLSLRLLAFEFGDDRTQLNPTTTGNLFVRLGAVYRFHLDKEEELNE